MSLVEGRLLLMGLRSSGPRLSIKQLAADRGAQWQGANEGLCSGGQRDGVCYNTHHCQGAVRSGLGLELRREPCLAP